MSSKTNFPSINTSTVLYHNDSRVVFKGDWNHNQVWIGPDGEVVTFSSTTDVEANVGLDAYQAPAGTFSYYGFKLAERGRYGICVDCSLLAPNMIIINAFDANFKSTDGPVALHTALIQPSDQHTVLLWNQQRPGADGTMPPSRLTITKFELIFPSANPIDSTTSSLSTTATTSSSSSAPSTVTPSLSQKSQSKNVGPIVGGVLGGLLLVTFLALLLYYTLIRPQKHNRIVHRSPLTRTVPNRAPPSLNYLVRPFVPPKMPSPVTEDSPHPYIRTKNARNATSEQVTESDNPFAHQDQRVVVTLPRSKASVPAKSVPLTINIPRESKGQPDRNR